MSKSITWKILAAGTISAEMLITFGLAIYLASLVYASGEIFFASITFILVLDALLRGSIRVTSWFWPDQCDSDWLRKNPPLFRFDRATSERPALAHFTDDGTMFESQTRNELNLTDILAQRVRAGKPRCVQGAMDESQARMHAQTINDLLQETGLPVTVIHTQK